MHRGSLNCLTHSNKWLSAQGQASSPLDCVRLQRQLQLKMMLGKRRLTLMLNLLKSHWQPRVCVAQADTVQTAQVQFESLPGHRQTTQTEQSSPMRCLHHCKAVCIVQAVPDPSSDLHIRRQLDTAGGAAPPWVSGRAVDSLLGQTRLESHTGAVPHQQRPADGECPDCCCGLWHSPSGTVLLCCANYFAMLCLKHICNHALARNSCHCQQVGRQAWCLCVLC